MTREIYVFGDWQELGGSNLGGPQLMGLLRAEIVHGKETFSFEYDPQWLSGANAMLLDPELQFFPGPQYSSDNDRSNFGMFLDSSPDRWGQLLMRRREASEARVAGRRTKSLVGSDFLLGVHDEQRMGGLRFKTELDGEFLSDEKGPDGQRRGAPPWARLRELENAAWRFQKDEGQTGEGQTSERLGNEDDATQWLRLLMAPGSSIGGARPKAGVRDEEQNLWIAKFPGRNDHFDVGGWELVTHRLARDAGLDVAEATAEKFGRPHHTFMVKRFDRVVENGERKRRHFASAMTMLGYSDGTSFKDGASYLEIVEFLIRHGAATESDMHELWRRIVFSICVSNTDDHLRNHGFLLLPDGWKLSPAYDINPDPTGTGLSLNVSDVDNSLNLELALEVAVYFRLDNSEAGSIMNAIKQTVVRWPDIADQVGIPRGEQEMMRPAFRAVEG
ncbi:MAG: HipA domain-containing protein [Rubripirellula sp.]|nr:HipA domain-containing protein [Rubripirellula sp.]